MFSRDAANLYFNPGCALSLYCPENAETILDYLRENFPKVQTHNICCRHDPKLPDGSVIINVCAGCNKRFGSLYNGISTISLWEVIDGLDHFPFPDCNGMEVSIHDPCPVRNDPGVHNAVRNIVKKLNLKIVEADKIRANSLCCGDSLYPDCDSKKIYDAMKRRADGMPCENVVVYCVSCIKAMHVGGKAPCHLTDLLLGKATDPQECDIERWHQELDAYIQTH